MRIKNIDGLSANDLQQASDSGARFIYYAFTISFLVVTFKSTSGVYLIRSDENSFLKGIPYTLVSFFFGWWGIPYGPKYTLESIRTNLHGGKDVTDEVMATVEGYLLFRETEKNKFRNINSLK
jgi:hypothetical protein